MSAAAPCCGAAIMQPRSGRCKSPKKENVLDTAAPECYTNAIDLDRFPVRPGDGTGTIGKTVRIRCGAAAVIGQASEPEQATAAGLPSNRPWEGSSEVVTSRKPEDLPAEELL